MNASTGSAPRLGYYPGCSLEGISTEYDESIRALFAHLEITIEDLPDWICCGTLAAHKQLHRQRQVRDQLTREQLSDASNRCVMDLS
ncbi:MAG: heterodisulfide reductase-related iron-sulfur binding cluster, partial [Chloroflexi bacterium]|nr:heterodisulfide reductase-related iron-sulfur binding cluster [Chloroflexota bacterium]